jgi:glycogen synthase kinase 3 beta
MNPQCGQFDPPALPPIPWRSAFRASADPLAVDLVSKLRVFASAERLRGYASLLHPFFNELRDPGATLPNGKWLRALFDFTHEEGAFTGADVLRQLVPARLQTDARFVERMDPLGVVKGDEEEE